MIKLTFIYLKRYISRKTNIAIMLISPIILALLFSVAIAPTINDNRLIDNFSVALVDNDDSMQTKLVVNHLINSDSVKDLVDVKDADLETAKEMLNDDEVAAIVIIPKEFGEKLMNGESMTFDIILSETQSFSAQLITNMLTEAVSLISLAQSGVDTIYFAFNESPLEYEEFKDDYHKSFTDLYSNIFARNEMFINKRDVSLFGDLVPIEYFISALVVVLLMISAMIVIDFNVKDYKSGIIRRLELINISNFKLNISKLLAGTIFLMIEFIIVIIILFSIFDAYIKINLAATFISIFIIALFANILCLFLSSIINDSIIAKNIYLAIILILTLLSGIIIPFAYLPDFVQVIGELSAVNISLDLFINVFFDYDAKTFILNNIYLLIYCIILFAGLYYKERRECF